MNKWAKEVYEEIGKIFEECHMEEWSFDGEEETAYDYFKAKEAFDKVKEYLDIKQKEYYH